MQQRRRIARPAPGKNPVLAALMSVALIAAAAFGGSQIVQVQSLGGGNVSVDLASESFAAGDNIAVDDAAVMTQGGEQVEHRVVKEFSRETPFSMVALTWEGERDIVAYVRAERADGSWSEWYQMDPATNTAETAKQGTDPIYIEKTNRIQVSTGNVDLLEDGRTESEAPTTANDLEAVFIDGGEGTVEGDIAPVANTFAAGMPKVVSRASWGAQNTGRTPYYTEPTKAITVHHTAGSNNYSAAEAPGIVRGIQGFHISQGWGDVGYNALVDKYGNIYEGRAGGLDRGPMGAHVGSFNDHTWGISMLGNYDTAEPTAAGIRAMGEMIGWKAAQANINPLGNVQLTASGNFSGSKFSAGQTGIFPTINAHRDFHNNACPGRYLYSQMGAIRTAANTKYLQLRSGAVINQPPTPGAPKTDTTTNPDGTITNIISSEGSPLGKISLAKLAEGDPAAIAGAVGTVAGVVILYMLQSGSVPQGVTKVGQTEIIPGLSLSSLTPYIGQILKFVGGQEAADTWKQFEPFLGTLQGAAAGIGGNNFAFYSNGIGVQNNEGEIYTLVGKIADAWLQQGLDAGPLGLPTSQEYNPAEDEVKVDFEGGSITYSPSSNAVDIDLSSQR
ncbi:N-acetylmuramoyl-L-alanine amidase [Corynebacterium qintianiae]|uniref:N-acetylmuramoyl-L-alanine amidase n=1 Tax=Corynebacterium qintianiae TaxID=2709392 RepID=UPI002018355E|nr:N-acetylmuramoyl-L-alanine amidase [Corynebacterium qintianiae]